MRKRLAKLLKFWKTKETLRDVYVRPKEVNDPKLHPEFDYQPIQDPRELDIDFENAITLSLYGCHIMNVDFIAEILKKMPKLKALWINENPCIHDEQKQGLFHHFVVNHHPGIEILNSKFTKHTREWGLKYTTFGGNMQLVENTNHEDMLYVNISDRNFGAMKENTDVMKSMKKCTLMILNGESFKTMGECNEFLLMIKEMPKLTHLEMDYYLLDLFWKIKDSIKQLNPTLKYINGYDIGFGQPKEEDEDTDDIIKNIWKVVGTYRIATGGNQVDTLPIIYVQDEVGNAITHSDDPNVMSMPFIFFPQNGPKGGCRTFNLVWPLKDINVNDFITCNKLYALDEKVHSTKLGLWQEVDSDQFVDAYTKRQTQLSENHVKGKAIIEQELAKEQSAPLKSILTSEEITEGNGQI